MDTLLPVASLTALRAADRGRQAGGLKLCTCCLPSASREKKISSLSGWLAESHQLAAPSLQPSHVIQPSCTLHTASRPHMKMMTKPDRAQARPNIWMPLQAGSGGKAVGGRQWLAGRGRQATGPPPHHRHVLAQKDSNKEAALSRSLPGPRLPAHLCRWNHNGSQSLPCLATRMPTGMSRPHPTAISQPCAFLRCVMWGDSPCTPPLVPDARSTDEEPRSLCCSSQPPTGTALGSQDRVGSLRAPSPSPSIFQKHTTTAAARIGVPSGGSSGQSSAGGDSLTCVQGACRQDDWKGWVGGSCTVHLDLHSSH